MTTPHVVGVSGSLRSGSYSRVGIRSALVAAADAGGTTEFLDLRDYELPHFDSDEQDRGDAPELRAQMREADAILLGTPMYHGSYSSTLKTAIDYCGFDEFGDKTIGLLAVAGGSFPLPALEHLRSVCRALNAWVLPHQVAIPRAAEKIEGGAITDEDLQSRTETLGVRAVEYAGVGREPPTFTGAENVGAADDG